MSGLVRNKVNILLFLFFFLPAFVLPKDHVLKLYFYELKKNGKAPDFSEIEINLIPNTGNEKRLELSKGAWYHFKKYRIKSIE